MIIARDDRILIRTSGRFILASMIIFYIFERASCNFLRVARRSIYFYIESCSIRERGITMLKFVAFGPGILFYFFILSLINNRNKFLVEALESEFFFVVDVPFL